MQLFYTPDIEVSGYIFNKEESRHIVRVLRKTTGDTVHHTDGKGNIFYSAITSANDKACEVKVNKTLGKYGKRNFHLTIAIAPTKNISRFEWFLEKATEIGIDDILPFFSFHSERKSLNPDRLEKIIIAAMKQSVKAYKPDLKNILPFKEILKMPFDGRKLIAYVDTNITADPGSEYRPGENALILIGPEGDFSKEEVNLAIEEGFVPINLGKSRLRTETAGIVACTWINILNRS